MAPRLNDIENNKEVENDDDDDDDNRINANHEKTGQTNKNVLLQNNKTSLLLPVTQFNGPAIYFNFNFNLNLAPISICCLLQLLATSMARENIIQRQKEDQ